MGKRVAVQADFTDTLYIERAGIQSAIEGDNSVWCQTAALHRRAAVVGSASAPPLRRSSAS